MYIFKKLTNYLMFLFFIYLMLLLNSFLLVVVECFLILEPLNVTKVEPFFIFEKRTFCF